MAEIRVKNGTAKLPIGGRNLIISVYRIEDLPGIFLYEKNGHWKIAHEAEGQDLHEGVFANKKQAATAAIMFLKDLDMTQNLSKLAANPAFKQALNKLDAAAKLRIGKGLTF